MQTRTQLWGNGSTHTWQCSSRWEPGHSNKAQFSEQGLGSAYYVLSTIQSARHVSIHLILTAFLGYKCYYYSHLT